MSDERHSDPKSLNEPACTAQLQALHERNVAAAEAKSTAKKEKGDREQPIVEVLLQTGWLRTKEENLTVDVLRDFVNANYNNNAFAEKAHGENGTVAKREDYVQHILALFESIRARAPIDLRLCPWAKPAATYHKEKQEKKDRKRKRSDLVAGAQAGTAGPLC